MPRVLEGIITVCILSNCVILTARENYISHSHVLNLVKFSSLQV